LFCAPAVSRRQPRGPYSHRALIWPAANPAPCRARAASTQMFPGALRPRGLRFVPATVLWFEVHLLKFMLFIDGTWLSSNTSLLVEASGQPGFVLDFGKLPRVLAEEVGERLGHDEYTVVRTHLFGSFAANVDERDLEPVERRLNFFTMLRQQHHYEI